MKKKELSAIIVTKGSLKKKHFCKVFHKSFHSFVCCKWQTTGCWEVGQVLWHWCRTAKKPKTLELDKFSTQNYGNQFRNLITKDFKNGIFKEEKWTLLESFERFRVWKCKESFLKYIMWFLISSNSSTVNKKFFLVRCNLAA